MAGTFTARGKAEADSKNGQFCSDLSKATGLQTR